jgi:hypothetical protein
MTLTPASADATGGAAVTEHQPEARAVCEHFYASHCYRGMSVRLCMTCHEPDWDDLAGQLAEARASEITAEPFREASLAPVPAKPVDAATQALEGTPGAGRVEQDAAQARTLISGALLGELGRRLYEYENAIVWDTSCLSCPAVLDRAAEETFRRERAEAKLAEIRILVEAGWPGRPAAYASGYAIPRILAIIGSDTKGRSDEEGTDRG